MRLLGDDAAIKALNLAAVLPLSAYWLFATPAGPPFWQISLCAWVGLGWLAATLLPGNALRINLLPQWRDRWRWFARRRRTMGLMAGLWFFGHYNLAVKMVRTKIGGPDEIQARFDPVLDNGQIATFIFLILFLTSYGWAMRVLKADWRRLHSLAWLVVPLILVHSISAKLAFERTMTHVSLVLLLLIIGFAAYEFGRLMQRRHPDRWRHAAMLGIGLLIAFYFRFGYR